ncbi:MAG: pentapeptide repeat-containing protein [Solirubrobacterales bacterium]|nr:pentapeptide repeat-containing protein [Solirubrobacterales bacterium]
MRSFAKVLGLSLLSVALLAGSAQALTVNGCKIKAGTSCHHKNLNGKNLRGAKLSGATLHHVKLRNADLRNADLRKADLREADLRGANLKGAKLHYYTAPKKKGARTSATLKCGPKKACPGANLAGANLTNAVLNYANLTNANLTITYFYNTTCQNGILTFPSMHTAGVLLACPAYQHQHRGTPAAVPTRDN